jgi:hypothetical protein
MTVSKAKTFRNVIYTSLTEGATRPRESGSLIG